MAREDQVAGRTRQARGKGNEVMGAVKGDTSQQIKGKVQKAVGKAQAKAGKATSRSSTRRGADAR